MKITLITPGKIKYSFYKEAEQELKGRIEKFCDFSVVEIAEEKLTKNTPSLVAKEKEARKILEKIPQGAEVICLDERGKDRDAQEFSKLLETKIETGKEIVFLIGGANGLHSTLLERAQTKWSLGKMTLTQDLARVCFLESLFRGFCILKNLPFHR
jgi:23S rRNA (pseudouridine1915-N3)-methyltransferase